MERKGFFHYRYHALTYTPQIDAHPDCVDVDEMSGNICDSLTLALSQPHYHVHSDADFVYVDEEYRVDCEAGT